MNRIIQVQAVGVLLAAMSFLPSTAHAFASVDEQISRYHEILDTGNYKARYEMLERLQWSGLSDPRLFDRIEAFVLERYRQSSFNRNELNLVAHHVRALGYSGNEKYRATLNEVWENAVVGKLKSHASRAKTDLDDFVAWHAKIDASDFRAEGKPIEIALYMKMLSVDDTQVQRLAARAIYHERQSDPDLLEMAANRIRAQYMLGNLDREQQDTVAWLCKAVGENAPSEYGDLMRKVADETPHKKIRRYASSYAR